MQKHIFEYEPTNRLTNTSIISYHIISPLCAWCLVEGLLSFICAATKHVPAPNSSQRILAEPGTRQKAWVGAGRWSNFLGRTGIHSHVVHASSWWCPYQKQRFLGHGWWVHIIDWIARCRRFLSVGSKRWGSKCYIEADNRFLIQGKHTIYLASGTVTIIKTCMVLKVKHMVCSSTYR